MLQTATINHSFIHSFAAQVFPFSDKHTQTLKYVSEMPSGPSRERIAINYCDAVRTFAPLSSARPPRPLLPREGPSRAQRASPLPRPAASRPSSAASKWWRSMILVPDLQVCRRRRCAILLPCTPIGGTCSVGGQTAQKQGGSVGHGP